MHNTQGTWEMVFLKTLLQNLMFTLIVTTAGQTGSLLFYKEPHLQPQYDFSLLNIISSLFFIKVTLSKTI